MQKFTLALLAFPLAFPFLGMAQDTVKKPEVWPSWLTVGGEIRGRGEFQTGVNFVPDNNNFYYLHRLRLNAGAEAAPWMRFYAEVQDSEAPGYGVQPAPTNVVNPLDVRQVYVEFGAKTSGWNFRAGRQELIYGEERLVGASNWGNVGRSFDAARLSYMTKSARLDWFGGTVVAPIKGFDRFSKANQLYGFYSSFKNVIPKGVFEPYWLWKSSVTVKDEHGHTGHWNVYTYGVRMLGPLPGRFDYNTDAAIQNGHAAGDKILAGAVHGQVGYKLKAGTKAPRIYGEYNYASGDGNATDGNRNTFDQLYPTNHNKYGTDDRIGWRNIHDVAGGVEWPFAKGWKWISEYHQFWLASVQDSLYTEAGAVFVRNPKATSRHVGQEIDNGINWQINSRLQLGAGLAHMFAGEFLRQATKGSDSTYPYIVWLYKF